MRKKKQTNNIKKSKRRKVGVGVGGSQPQQYVSKQQIIKKNLDNALKKLKEEPTRYNELIYTGIEGKTQTFFNAKYVL